MFLIKRLFKILIDIRNVSIVSQKTYRILLVNEKIKKDILEDEGIIQSMIYSVNCVRID